MMISRLLSLSLSFSLSLTLSYTHTHSHTHTTDPNCQSVLTGPLDGIQCPHKTDECLCWSANKCVSMWWKSTREPRLLVHPCFSSSAQLVCLVFLRLFPKYEINSHTTVVFWDSASKNCSKLSFLCTSHLTFFSKSFV